MFALIGMFIVGLWFLRILHSIILNLMIGAENQRQLHTIELLLKRCKCCGGEKCIYSAD